MIKKSKKIKCPACGKLNSQSLQSCQECGTTLKFIKGDDLVGVSEGELNDYKKQVEEIKKKYNKQYFQQKDRIGGAIDYKDKIVTHSIKIEKNIPQSYGTKRENETKVQFEKRHLEYGYVKENEYLIYDFSADYLSDKQRLKLKTDLYEKSRKVNGIEENVTDYIDIEESAAKSFYGKNQYGNIYSKYIIENRELIKTFNVMFNYRIYRITSSDQDIIFAKKQKIKKEKERKKEEEIRKEQQKIEEMQLKYADSIIGWAENHIINRIKIPRVPAELLKIDTLNLKKGFFDFFQKDIYELPNELRYLKNIKYIYLSNNKLRSFPKVIYQMKNLISLELVNNKISNMPDLYTLINMKKNGYALESIDLTNNEGISPIVKPKDYKFIHNYLYALRNGNRSNSYYDIQYDEVEQILKKHFNSYIGPIYQDLYYYVFILKVIGIEIQGVYDHKYEITCSSSTIDGFKKFLLTGEVR